MSPTTIISAAVGQPTSLNLRASAQFTIGRNITVLFKECLMIMEQLKKEHDEAMGKLYEALPEQYRPYVGLADHFTEDKEARIKKAIRDRGNDCKRAMEAELDQYELTFRPPQS